ncbi:MAG: hypothetical protein GKR89_29370 [Candidatus Latescibacteria bacterium]|nr:hypothetical protein [Candidatus Latescibacterota bacterium]
MSFVHQAKWEALIAAKRGASFATTANPLSYPPSLELEPTHLAFDLFFDLENECVSGTLTTTVRANRNGADQIEIDAVDFVALELEEAEGRPITTSYDGTKARITWAEGFSRGEERKLVATYKAERPVTGLYFSRPTSQRPDLQWFCGSDHETERARYWIPCVDLPAVRTTLEMKMRCQSRFRALSNGTEVGTEDNGDGTSTTTWRLEQRCPSYLIAVCLGELVEWRGDDFEGRPIAAFTTKDHSAESLERSFGPTKAMMEWMADHFDMPFPYPKYFQYALPSFGGAMENISLVSWDDMFVLDPALQPEWTWLVDQINLHEMSHSYFGDHIVCRDYAHAWLKESWATYIETAWLEFSKGEDEKRYDFWCDCKAYMEEADNSYMRPLMTRHFESSWQLYDRHLYPGGAARLHTLRSIMGDEDFWNGTRAYLKRYAGKTVETEDFRRVMEEVSGRSLVHFFDQWIYSKGYPDLKVSFAYDDKRKIGTFEIEQKQVDAKKKPEEQLPTFHLETDLGWVVDGKSDSMNIAMDQAVQSFTVPMQSEPSQVRFDPHMRVLHKLEFNPGDDKLKEQLVNAPDVIGRICAANQLCKTGRAATIRAVGDAYKNEAFWGVRCDMATAVGKAQSEMALDVILEMVASEQDPMVVATVMGAAANFRDSRIGAASQQRLEAGLPPMAQGEAYAALGAQRENAPLELLGQAAQDKALHFFAHRGALRGLAATRSESAGAILKSMTPHGASPLRSRPASFAALAHWASHLSQQQKAPYRECLEDILRDPMERMRTQAASALGDLGDPAATAALNALFVREPIQNGVDIKDSIKRLGQAGDASGAAKLEKRIEELEDERRKLEDRLRKLEEKLD